MRYAGWGRPRVRMSWTTPTRIRASAMSAGASTDSIVRGGPRPGRRPGPIPTLAAKKSRAIAGGIWQYVNGNRVNASAKSYVEWRRQATEFVDVNAWTQRSVNVATADHPENVGAGVATPRCSASAIRSHSAARSVRTKVCRAATVSSC